MRGADLRSEAGGSRFSLGGVTVTVPLPGAHNASNALAAIAAAHSMEIDIDVAAGAIADFRGVKRRYERVGEARGIRVVDDFGHKPDEDRRDPSPRRGTTRLGCSRCSSPTGSRRRDSCEPNSPPSFLRCYVPRTASGSPRSTTRGARR